METSASLAELCGMSMMKPQSGGIFGMIHCCYEVILHGFQAGMTWLQTVWLLLLLVYLRSSDLPKPHSHPALPLSLVSNLVVVFSPALSCAYTPLSGGKIHFSKHQQQF